MKRLPAILFLLILVFNYYGYQVVISYMEKSSEAVMEAKLDRDEYNDNELLSIKTTLNLPYYSSSPVYERAYGSVNLNGVVYQYVKRRIYKDTLELLCLPNVAKTKLQSVSNELVKTSSDGQASLPVKKTTTTLKIPLPDFFQSMQTFLPVVTASKKNYLFQNESFLLPGLIFRQERPPQTLLFIS